MLRLDGGDMPLGSHLALASLASLLVVALFSDLGLRELLTAAYYAAIMYGVMELCHGYLRELAPAEPRRVPVLRVAAFMASTMGLTVAFEHVMGTNPLAPTPAHLALATGLFLLFFAAFVDPTTNRTLLRRSKDPKRPYAGLPRWVPTWRAATLPLAALIAVAYVGEAGLLDPAWVPLLLVAMAAGHIGSLAFASRRG
jgi:hypothetical protein